MKSVLKKCIYFVAASTILGASVCSMPLSMAKADSNSETRYYDAPSVMYASEADETITFSRKEEELVELPYDVPVYFSNTLSNACGPIAGAMVVGFYDKYYENLIPNYVTYYTANGRYRRPDSTYIPALMQNLYTLMQTNVVDVGVSVSECLSGLQQYVVSKGRNITYTDIKSTTFNETAYKNGLSNLKPSLLFYSGANLYQLRTGDTQDEVLYVLTSNSHIVVGTGYCKIRYYDSNNTNFRTDTYLIVSTGWQVNSTAYIKANDTSWLDDGYVVNIY